MDNSIYGHACAMVKHDSGILKRRSSAAHDTLGCDDHFCEVLVCIQDASCCSAPWDQDCLDLALVL
jgi:hypothetical protein